MEKSITILLAGGEGQRMQSGTPKALHSLCGRTLLDWVLHAAPAGGEEPPVAVLGFGAQKIQARYQDTLRYVQQGAPYGTGSALLAARRCFDARSGRVLVLACDLPLLQSETLSALARINSGAAFLSATLANPAGHGRVLRDGDGVRGIVRAEDVDATTRTITEIRVSAYCFDAPLLLRALDALEEEHPHDGFGMSDIIAWLINSGECVDALPIPPEEAIGVNDRAQLADCAARMRARINNRHMLAGVTFIDPAAAYVDDTVKLGRDCVIYPGVVLEGNTVIGEGTTLYPACRLTNSVIGRSCALQGVVANDAIVGDNVSAGPYVHLRPNTRIGDTCKIGNYIEVKNSNVGEGAKLPHLSYIGDSDIGRRVNMGCGSVTVNYDGVKKHRTIVGDDAFIGCHTSLVAPVRVGEGAFTAAGSTITKDVPDYALAVARERQTNKEGYAKRLKQKT